MARAKLTTIGRAEYLQFVGQANAAVPAKVDTGADSSSVWASNIRLDRDDLVFVLFDPSSIYYTGEEIRVPSGQYREVIVENSFGNKETRYGAKLAVRIKGRRVKTTFTLADRSTKTYPVLLGRRLLKGKFLVDVSQGEPLLSEEQARRAKRQSQLKSSDSTARM